MPVKEGKVRTSTGIARAAQPLTALRPVYDAAGVLTGLVVEAEAQFDDGSTQEIRVDLFPLLTAAQRTVATNFLNAVATRLGAYLQ